MSEEIKPRPESEPGAVATGYLLIGDFLDCHPGVIAPGMTFSAKCELKLIGGGV